MNSRRTTDRFRVDSEAKPAGRRPPTYYDARCLRRQETISVRFPLALKMINKLVLPPAGAIKALRVVQRREPSRRSRVSAQKYANVYQGWTLAQCFGKSSWGHDGGSTLISGGEETGKESKKSDVLILP
jgi:hypothetical protein